MQLYWKSLTKQSGCFWGPLLDFDQNPQKFETVNYNWLFQWNKKFQKKWIFSNRDALFTKLDWGFQTTLWYLTVILKSLAQLVYEVVKTHFSFIFYHFFVGKSTFWKGCCSTSKTFSKVRMEAMLVMISALNTFNRMPFHGSTKRKVLLWTLIFFDFSLTRQRMDSHFK